MYSSKGIGKVLVFCPSKLKREKDNFLKLLKSSTDEFNFKIQNVNVIDIQRDMDPREWMDKATQNLNPSVNFAIFIITGPKTGNKVYKSLKNHLYEKFPVPS